MTSCTFESVPTHVPGMLLPRFEYQAPETLEEAVHREVREEVGVELASVRYATSQPWPFPHSLMIAFTAEYVGGEIRCDDDEIAEARWFPADAMPPLPPSVSIARRLIDQTAARSVPFLTSSAHGTSAMCSRPAGAA